MPELNAVPTLKTSKGPTNGVGLPSDQPRIAIGAPILFGVGLVVWAWAFFGKVGGYALLTSEVLMIAGVVMTFRNFVRPRCEIELDREPLHPGDTAHVRLYIRGQFGTNTLPRCELRCMCRDTEIRPGAMSEIRQLRHEIALLDQKEFAVRGGDVTIAAWEGDLTLPADAPTSAHGGNHEVLWRLEVTLTLPREREHAEAFTFRVVPG